MRTEYPIEELCVTLRLSRSGWYASQKQKRLPSSRQRANQVLSEAIRDIHSDRHMRAYGSPRMQAELRSRGHVCSVNRVARLMRQYGLRGASKRAFRPKTTQGQKTAQASPNLLAEAAAPTRPGEQMVADITYLPTRQGWLYLSVVIDRYSRAVLGCNLSSSLAAQGTLQAWVNARRKIVLSENAIFHSDRGCQYTSRDFRSTLHGVRQSMSAQGYCYDNALAESFFASLKNELLEPLQIFDSQAHARLMIFDYIECFYNRRRRHSSLHMRTPQQMLDLAEKSLNPSLN